MRILVVGLGSMGRRRLRNLTHLGGHDLAGLELLDARREEVGREAGIPVFGSLEEAFGWEPDALVISTPPDQHAPYALAAAERGLHFFTEASVVTTGMEEVIEAARGKDIVTAPSCTMRFHPACAKLRALIAGGAIGKPLTFTHHVGQWLPDWHPWEDYRTFYVAKRETGAAREIVPFELNWLTQLFGPVTELNAFVDVARGDTPSPCTVADALEAFRTAEACARSMATGSPVDLASIPTVRADLSVRT